MLQNSTSNVTVPVNVLAKKASSFETDLIVPLYAIIFVLSVVGNVLVLITLLQNRRMRTVTNVFLLNLVSILFCRLHPLDGSLLCGFDACLFRNGSLLCIMSIF